jgi:hypothetical protein
MRIAIFGLMLFTVVAPGLSQTSSTGPVVTSVVPAGAYRGGTTYLRLVGQNLSGASVSFDGSGVSATFDSTVGLPAVSVSPGAPLGTQHMTVATSAGTTSSCGSAPCTFQVIDSGAWQDLSNSPFPAGFNLGVVVRLLDGKVLFAGGYVIQLGQFLGSTAVWIFDPSAGQWEKTAPLLEASFTVAGCLLPDGRVLVIDGSGLAEVFDPSAGAWSKAGTTTPGEPILLA